MATTRIREKISALVSSQLPEFIQSDFPTFVAFIEAYYRFLEQDQSALEIVQNARSYNDVDRTTDAFVRYFLDTYAKSIPQTVLVEDRFLVKKIRDLYEAKGSELSFKLLFRILFNTTVDVRYPYENVLRASGGRWQQSFSIRVKTITGDRNDLVNRVMTHTASGVIFQTPIIKTKILTSTLTELFLNNTLLSSSYQVGDLIQVFENSTLVFSGTIEPTTTTFTIEQPGIGFKVGQVINIAAGGIDTLVKITQVSSSGGIVRLKIINYGYGYVGDSGGGSLTIVLDKDQNISRRNNFFTSTTSGFGSSGFILRNSPASPDRYFQEDYVDDIFYTITDIASSFNNDLFSAVADTTGGTVDSSFAVIKFTLGALAKYPGAYVTDESFLSEFEVRLQDDQLYQPFAYQTNTELDISSFVDVVKKLLNPAGQVLFNNRTLLQQVNLADGLLITTDRKIFVNIHDSVKYFDSALREVNTFNDIAAILDTDETYNFNKILSDNVNQTDFNSFELQKDLVDNAATNDTTIVSKIYLREFNDNVVDSDDDSIVVGKVLSDNSNVTEEISKIEIFVQDYFEEEYSENLSSPLGYVLTKTNEILTP